MRIVDMGRIADAINAGRRAESRIHVGPVASSTSTQIMDTMSTSDYMRAASLQSAKKKYDFVWSSDTWGDPNYKVAD